MSDLSQDGSHDGSSLSTAKASQTHDTPMPDPKTGHADARFWTLALGSIGVVFGDIGTSPLYAFREALAQAAKDGLVKSEVLGVVSLALWALILVVTVKYVLFLMRADNKGEGGVLSLMALAQRALNGRTRTIFILGACGAALFYGDAVITPAISVLSAVEGLRTVPAIAHLVTPSVTVGISLVILFALFMVQSKGTEKVATLFGPICLVWFGVIGGLGLWHAVLTPEVFAAFSPTYAVGFLMNHGVVGLLVLGSVFLTVTGAEALYADMGHFGRWPIQASWLFLVLPCLMLNYLGQGAFALGEVSAALAAHRPAQNLDWFFLMAPEAMRIPLVVLAGMATIIASQAVITGAFSLTNQAIQLGLLPRMVMTRTSQTHAGQIFLPRINLLLMVGVFLLVAMFKSSSNLSHAYGLAVTGTMAVTTSLAFIVVRRLWKWSLLASVALIAPMLALDLVFLGANALKILSGGWAPLVIGGALFTVIATWAKGADILARKVERDSPRMDDIAAMLSSRSPHRIDGTAVYLTGAIDYAPVALMHNLKHNKVLHRRNVVLTVKTAETPRVDLADRVTLTRLNDDFSQIVLSYGFMESPNVPKALARRKDLDPKIADLKLDIMATSYFVGRRSVVPASRSEMPAWQDQLFIFLMKNAANPTDFFHIPPGRVVEMGVQVSI
jgi:KUP system potassium uptake protein